MSSSSLPSDPSVKTEETVSRLQNKTEETANRLQTNNVKEVGTPPVRSNLCTLVIAVSTAVRNKVVRTVSRKQLLRNNSAARQTNHSAATAQLHLPPLDLFWALHAGDNFSSFIVLYVHKNHSGGEPRTATSTFIQLLSSVDGHVRLCVYTHNKLSNRHSVSA